MLNYIDESHKLTRNNGSIDGFLSLLVGYLHNLLQRLLKKLTLFSSICYIEPVYHVETPNSFISSPYLIWAYLWKLTGFNTVISCKFPVKMPI